MFVSNSSVMVSVQHTPIQIVYISIVNGRLCIKMYDMHEHFQVYDNINQCFAGNRHGCSTLAKIKCSCLCTEKDTKKAPDCVKIKRAVLCTGLNIIVCHSINESTMYLKWCAWLRALLGKPTREKAISSREK